MRPFRWLATALLLQLAAPAPAVRLGVLFYRPPSQLAEGFEQGFLAAMALLASRPDLAVECVPTPSKIQLGVRDGM